MIGIKWLRSSVIGAVGVLAASLTITGSTAAAATPGLGETRTGALRAQELPTYQIMNQRSGKCLDKMSEDGNRDDARVQQWHCSGANEQKWQLYYDADGYWQIYNVTAGAKCLSGYHRFNGNGVPVVMSWCGQGENQQWTLTKTIDFPIPYYTFRDRLTGRCLDVPNASPEAGVPMQEWECNGTVAQNFSFR
jgi:hypothetical protein